MSIKDIWEKIKNGLLDKEKEIALALILILVAIFSFGLGRLSKIEALKEPITIEGADLSVVEEGKGETAVTKEADSISDEKVYASSRGKKYYFEWCGADSLSPKNKISFSSEEEAQKAGYTVSAGCSN